MQGTRQGFLLVAIWQIFFKDNFLKIVQFFSNKNTILYKARRAKLVFDRKKFFKNLISNNFFLKYFNSKEFLTVSRGVILFRIVLNFTNCLVYKF